MALNTLAQKARIFWIILDSLGVGASPDAVKFGPLAGGDVGANTLWHLISATKGLDCPVLQKMGLANILVNDTNPNGHPLWSPVSSPFASFGKMMETSAGKDTPSGHWEMAGCPLNYTMPVYGQGLPKEMLDRFVQRVREAGIHLPGALGGEPASGTEIIARRGEESIKTGMPIVYTSNDSVFQIAAHEEHFGLQKLYVICKIARTMLNEYPDKIGRVIARPFVGNNKNDFKRTHHRHDYSLEPPTSTVLDSAKAKGFDVISIGKIADIFAHRGLTQEITSTSNAHGMELLTEQIKRDDWSGIAFVNLVDFDMLYGHRRDASGYRQALEAFDAQLKPFLNFLQPNDFLVISADHGCDPTFKGTDHTREYVPVLFFYPGMTPKLLGTRHTFADVAATVAKILGLDYPVQATSFL